MCVVVVVNINNLCFLYTVIYKYKVFNDCRLHIGKVPILKDVEILNTVSHKEGKREIQDKIETSIYIHKCLQSQVPK